MASQKVAMVEQAVAMVAAQMEHQIDREMHRLDNLGEADIEEVRRKRVLEMKRRQDKTKEWLTKGHGEYREIATEKEFFDEMKGEEKMVCHFYRENWPCKVSRPQTFEQHHPITFPTFNFLSALPGSSL